MKRQKKELVMCSRTDQPTTSKSSINNQNTRTILTLLNGGED